MFKHFLILMVLLLPALTFVSCGDDEPELSTPTQPDETTTLNEVTINADGSTSTGVPFRRIDETTFMLNYVKYQIEDGHINAIGADYLEIGQSLKGSVKLFSTITIDGTPYKVREIADNCFSECSTLVSVTIPNTIEAIGEHCFSDCTSLTSVTIPNSVTSIGEYCFSDCTSLISVTIPNSVTSINPACFEYCSSLASITIPNSVTYIGHSCFEGCSSLTSITIPNSVTEFGGGSFSHCSSLTSITIPNSVTEIGGGCFSHCSSLTSITIPKSVKSIYHGEYGAFEDCTSLQYAVIENADISLAGFVGNRSLFPGCKSLAVVHIKDNATIVTKTTKDEALHTRFDITKYFSHTQYPKCSISFNSLFGEDYQGIGDWEINPQSEYYYPQGCRDNYVSIFDGDWGIYKEFDPATFDFHDYIGK